MKRYKINYDNSGGSRKEDSIDRMISSRRQEQKINASRIERSQFSFPTQPTLRMKIFVYYRKEFRPYFDFKTLESPSNILLKTNFPYSSRKINSGIYYPDDYLKLVGSTESWIQLQGMANSNYWNLATSDCFFKMKDNQKPSQALEAFFAGPTFADCANIIQASYYQYILNIIGPELFDKAFGNPVSQFIITKWLYDDFKSDSKENPIGNPLYFLFDKEDDISLENLDDGDIVYIEGIKEYTFKHLAGFTPGWNLIVIRKSKSDEPKFLGFGPETFSKGPLTLDELRLVFIKYYNEPQSEDTLRKIRLFKSKYESGAGISSLVTDEDSLNKARLHLAQTMADDIKPIDHPIVGLSHRIKFNSDKLTQFISFIKDKVAWYDLDTPILFEKYKIQPKKGEKRMLIELSAENRNSTFDNYLVKTETNRKLLNITKNFAYLVSLKETMISPLGLIISGNPGIGKTHLSISVLKAVNKNVLYVDEKFISDKYQEKAQYPDFKVWLNNIDLVILDDINSSSGIGSKFYKEAINYVIKNNKAILISSNSNLKMIYDSMPKYIGYNDQLVKNFLILNNLIDKSFRKPWIKTLVGLSNIKQIQELAQYSGNQAAGILIDTSEDETDYIKEYIKLVKTKPKIRILREPYRNNYVYDMYIHDADKYDLFISKVNTEPEAEQFIKLIEKVHDKGVKIIVSTNNVLYFKELIIKSLDDFLAVQYKQRRLDRLRIIYPGLL